MILVGGIAPVGVVQSDVYLPTTTLLVAGGLIGSRHRLIQRYHRRPAKTYCSATISHDWHTTVRYDSSRSSKVKNVHVM